MNKRLIALIPLLVVPLVVGGGFALFYFGDMITSNKDQNVSIDITDNPEIGSIELRYADKDGNYPEGNNEILNTEFKNQVFMDFDSVYLIRNDNPTTKRSFTIYYFKPQSTTSVYHLNITLFCEVTITDTDARGIEIVEFKDENEEERFYPSSKSVLDIYEPSVVLYEDWDDNFELISGGQENDTTATYRAIVRNNLLVDTTASRDWHTTFNLDFNYKDYSAIRNGERIEGNMAPSISESVDAYKNKIVSNRQAIEHSNVKITFYLKVVGEN